MKKAETTAFKENNHSQSCSISRTSLPTLTKKCLAASGSFQAVSTVANINNQDAL